MDRFFASSSTAAQPARQLSSIDDVRRWLTTLTEVTSTQKLESLRAAVNVLKTPKPKRDDVRLLVNPWSAQRDEGDKRPLAEVRRDLKEMVIKAGNALRANLEQHAQIATAGCAVLFVVIIITDEVREPNYESARNH